METTARPNTLAKVAVWATLGAAALHTLMGLMSATVLLPRHAAKTPPSEVQAVAWFIIAGLGLLLIGVLGLRLVRTTGELPEEYGVMLACIGAFALVAAHAWGGALLVAIGVLALVSALRRRR